MDEVGSQGSGSPLSDINSDEVESVKFNNRSRSNSTLSALSNNTDPTAEASPRQLDMPPAKRRKTGAAAYDHATPQSASTIQPPRSPTGSISSDSSGSVPTSPSFAHLGPTHPLSTAYAAAQANPDNPDAGDYFQVTRCLWDDCPHPEQGNMDNLVAHINEIHIAGGKKKFMCEWAGCVRRGHPQGSAYALKAHVRSHTKEKPFLCALPECDRSFTRSDALAKHMRTVHETESLRPSDPVPRGHTGGISNGNTMNGTIKRIKLTMGGGTNGEKRSSFIGDLPPLPTKYTAAQMGIKVEEPAVNSTEESEDLIDAVDIDSIPFVLPVTPEYYPPEVYSDMDDHERVLPPSRYFQLLHRQIKWAEEEKTDLDKDLEELRSTAEDVHGNRYKRGSGDESGADGNRRFEWGQTEHLLDQVLRTEAEQVQGLASGEVNRDPEVNPWTLLKDVEGHVRQRMEGNLPVRMMNGGQSV